MGGLSRPEKPFEPYADDVVVHCKTEKQVKFILRQISERLTKCKLTLHPIKTKIVNLRGKSGKKSKPSANYILILDIKFRMRLFSPVLREERMIL